MTRMAPSSSMQKTYDECYLICSTAIYFEGQSNECDALRSWRRALDHICHHKAYKMPSHFVARTETERALQDSLRAMERQCKERVDLLEALRASRVEAEQPAVEARPAAAAAADAAGRRPRSATNARSRGPADAAPVPMNNQQRPPPPPPLPPRGAENSSSGAAGPPRAGSGLQPRPTPPLPGESQKSRTPSPEKRAVGMLKTLRSNAKDGKPSGKPSGRMAVGMRSRNPAAAQAASSVWAGPPPVADRSMPTPAPATWDPLRRTLLRHTSSPHHRPRRPSHVPSLAPPTPSPGTPPDGRSSFDAVRHSTGRPLPGPSRQQSGSQRDDSVGTARPPPLHSITPPPPPPPPPDQPPTSLSQIPPTSISYMKEYPNNPPLHPAKLPNAPPSRPGMMRAPSSDLDGPSSQPSSITPASASPCEAIPRKAVGRAAGVVSATAERQKLDNTQAEAELGIAARSQVSGRPDHPSSSPDSMPRKQTVKKKIEGKPVPARAATPPMTDENGESDRADGPDDRSQWEARVKKMMKKLPNGVDEWAAKQIFNEIVIRGDEVHWDDVAGLEIAKSALKETVVYPFLRPDLFMGLREPARGMLLFGPPGTGKTMLARAVATESKSVFFAISASSLTSKYLGESEKLVRALFALAKALAPSIIFVDEIDSLLGSRGGSSEHEATRRIKTEFLIQWSDLQRAAAGRESSEGDASRVLVLAATNLPWAIDEAARRRFVRRQYIPLPEDWVREKQLRTLLAAQKHDLTDRDLKHLVTLTHGFSGSDMTALAKDAAMGPLRSLGERLLHTKPEDIRSIGLEHFHASLRTIRPSVSQAGLKEFDDWAREFGERGG